MAQNLHNTSTDDLSFLEKKNPNALSAKDVIITIVHNLHWIILCAAIGGAIAWLVSDRAERIYESHAKVKIQSVTRNMADGNVVTILEAVSNRRTGDAWNTLNDEIIVLKSETAMLEVARRLNLGMAYYYKTKVVKRVKDLYTDSPIDVALLDVNESDDLTFVVTVSPDSLYVLETSDGEEVKGRLRDTVSTPLGRVCVQPTWALRDLYYDNPIQVKHRNIYDVVADYRERVSITRNGSAEWIIDLQLKDTSPQRAADILNEMVAVYNDHTIREKTEIIRQTSDYINTRVAQLDNELGVQEAKIASFKRENQLLNVEEYGQAYIAASIESSEEVERLRAQISHAQYLQTLTSPSEEYRLFPITVDIDDEHIRNTIANYNENVLKLDKYKESGSSNNPLVQSINLELSTLKQNLNKLLSTYIGSLEQKILVVEDAGRRADSKIRSVPGGQVYLDNIARVQGIKEGLYLSLLSKREELLISQPSIEGNAKIIDRARKNPVPISPDTKRNMLIGILLGLCVPFVVFFLYRALDTKVRYRKDLEQYVDIPVLAEIPSKEKNDDRDIVIADKRRDAVSEAFRILRSNLEFTRKPDGSATSWLFLSLMENSGKTFITTNLAAGLALVERKVILLDLDLRKGTLTRNLKMKREAGFSNYLSGRLTDLSQIIRHDVIAPGVDVILSGPIPPNPAELLSNNRMDEAMAYLREHYDYILIDAIPSGIVADATLLKRFADVTVFILRSRVVDRRMLPDLQALKDHEEFPNMTIILNDVDYKKQNSRYGYGYGYGYGYEYGYGSTEPEKESEKEDK